jgi:ketosteroid isomerase-like protein
MHPDIEWVNPPDAIETGTRTGVAGFEEAESAFPRAYSSIDIEVELLEERGDEVFLNTGVLFHGRASGIEFRQRIAMIFTLRDGRVTRFEWSNDPERLLGRATSGENG